MRMGISWGYNNMEIVAVFANGVWPPNVSKNSNVVLDSSMLNVYLTGRIVWAMCEPYQICSLDT